MSISDNFNRSDANPIGGNWTTVTGLAALRITSNELANAGSNADSGAYYSGASWNNDQIASIDTVGSGNTDGGPLVRCSSSAFTAYHVTEYDGLAHLYKIVSGGFSELGSAGTGWGGGVTVTLEATGTSIVAKVGGTTTNSQTDSAVTSGSPGMFIYDSAVRFDNFVGTGEVVGGTTLTPDPAVVTLNAVTPTVELRQTASPDADLVIGTWTDQAGGTTNIYQSIDEGTLDIADYIKSVVNPSNAVYRGRLSNISTPVAGTRTIDWTIRKSSDGATMNAVLRLFEGVTLKETFTRSNVPSTWTTYQETITASISNYADLEYEIDADQA